MKKQKELDRLTKELVKQITGNEVEDPQEGDYQIAYYYLSKAMDYTHSCTELKDKEAISFEDWVDFEGHRDYYNDLVGNGFAYDIEKFYKRYIEAVKPSL